MSEDVLFLLLVLFMVFVVTKIANNLSTETEQIAKPVCDMHKWVYKAAEPGDEYMVCENCGRLPGEG